MLRGEKEINKGREKVLDEKRIVKFRVRGENDRPELIGVGM